MRCSAAAGSRVRSAGTTEAQTNPYTAVWAQQGRLLVDADLNEQAAIELDYLRTLAVDFIGPFGGHIDRAGFKVVPDGHGFVFSTGHYYVHGLRCEASPTIAIELPDAPFVIYLLDWEQTIGPIQDPTLADPALGPDAGNTTRRSMVAWRPHTTRRLHGSSNDLTGEEAIEQIIESFASHNADPGRRPLLRADVARAHVQEHDLSTVPAGVPYRGVENQLYRVEIHSGGSAGRATFKWSRDNGSVELALDSLNANAEGELIAKLSRSPIDARAGLEPGDWVELLDDDWAPSGEPAALLEVGSVRHSTREVVLVGAEGIYEFDEDRHPYLRRWDQSPAARAGDDAIEVVEVPDGADEWIELEDGVRVQFIAAGADYHRGDYWLIPARTATSGLLWLWSDDGPVALPPAGPARYRAPLALITKGSGDHLEVTDLRTLFTHLAWPGFSPDGG